MLGLCFGGISIGIAVVTWLKTANWGKKRYWLTGAVVAAGYAVMRVTVAPGIAAIEAVEPAKTGFLGGFGLPILFAWLVGGAFAAGIFFKVSVMLQKYSWNANLVSVLLLDCAEKYCIFK